jgi:hypothetical protein
VCRVSWFSTLSKARFIARVDEYKGKGRCSRSEKYVTNPDLLDIVEKRPDFFMRDIQTAYAAHRNEVSRSMASMLR